MGWYSRVLRVMQLSVRAHTVGIRWWKRVLCPAQFLQPAEHHPVAGRTDARNKFQNWIKTGRRLSKRDEAWKSLTLQPCHTTALFCAAAGLIVWKPCVLSPLIEEGLNGDSVSVISCTGAKNCLHGQLTGCTVSNSRRNRYRRGRS